MQMTSGVVLSLCMVDIYIDCIDESCYSQLCNHEYMSMSIIMFICIIIIAIDLLHALQDSFRTS